jgi:hypothetical protein
VTRLFAIGLAGLLGAGALAAGPLPPPPPLVLPDGGRVLAPDAGASARTRSDDDEMLDHLEELQKMELLDNLELFGG